MTRERFNPHRIDPVRTRIDPAKREARCERCGQTLRSEDFTALLAFAHDHGERCGRPMEQLDLLSAEATR